MAQLGSVGPSTAQFGTRVIPGWREGLRAFPARPSLGSACPGVGSACLGPFRDTGDIWGHLGTPWPPAGMSSDLDVFVGNTTLIDEEVYRLWLDGHSGEGHGDTPGTAGAWLGTHLGQLGHIRDKWDTPWDIWGQLGHSWDPPGTPEEEGLGHTWGHSRGRWDASGRHLGHIWDKSDTPEHIWRTLGTHLGDTQCPQCCPQ